MNALSYRQGCLLVCIAYTLFICVQYLIVEDAFNATFQIGGLVIAFGGHAEQGRLGRAWSNWAGLGPRWPHFCVKVRDR